MLGMAKSLNRHGISALAWNLRGCSGDLNLKEHFYHGGMSDDLQAVIDHVKGDFDEIYLIGFSLGGNMILKYLGEHSEVLEPKIKCGIAFSAPIDLKSCVPQVNIDRNWIYFKKFMYSVEQKLNAKASRLSLSLPIEKIKQVRSFRDLDDWFTAPSFGFENAEELWGKTSSVIHLEKISIPTLLVSAKDDPILGPECYPYEIAQKSKNFYFEAPEYGGHVGFMALNLNDEYWSETRALEFIEKI
jgi:predicted alpha/beta-fold hydrolase